MKYPNVAMQIGLVVGLFTGLAAMSVNAQQHSVDASVGGASISHSDFESGGAAMVSYSFLSGPIDFSIGAYGVSELESQDGHASIDVNGAYISAGHEFDVGPLFLDLQAGIAYSQSEASLYGVDIGEDNNASAMGVFAIGRQFNKLFGIRGGVTYINDVSGENLTLVHIGTRWNF